MAAIYLYPSLGLFEGTIVSVGRGTFCPFRLIGFPDYNDTSFKFTPRSIDGVSKNPMYKDSVCFGIDLQQIEIEDLMDNKQIDLKWITKMYNDYYNPSFFNDYFEMLAGNNELREQIMEGISIEDIKESWQADLELYKQQRQYYLLYPDF
ncbi:hypothetical protein ACFLTE_10855 [Bacteroidota bacterium]